MHSRKCPTCRTRILHRVRDESVELDVCVKCGGIWCDRGELDDVIKAHVPHFTEARPIASVLGKVRGTSDRKCPVCSVFLVTHPLTDDSDIDVDACPSCHGIWLDKGELESAEGYFEVSEAKAEINEQRTWKHWLFQFLFRLPVEFNIRPRRLPVVTIALVAANVLIPVLMASGVLSTNMLMKLVLQPDLAWSPWWAVTLISHQFLHVGVIHLIGNMYFLYILGDNVEDVMGRRSFLAFYLGCGVVAALAQVALGSEPGRGMLGASGAVAGVMGAYVVLFRKARLTFMFIVFQWKLPAIWYITVWLGINVLGALSGDLSIAWYAHLVGFSCGAIVAFMMHDRILMEYPLLRYLSRA